MLENLLWLFAGAVLGVALDRVWDPVWQRFAGTLRRRRSAGRVRTDATIHATVPQAYRSAGLGDSLIRASALPSLDMPMLFDESLSVSADAATGRVPFVLIDDPVRREFPVDRGVIRAKRASGAELWDGDVLYLVSAAIDEAGAGHVVRSLRVGVANYFSYVTVSNAWKSRMTCRGSDWLHGSPYRSLLSLLADPPMPLAIAAVAVCVFETGDGLRIPVATRSEAVVNGMGRAGLIPTFGLESNVKAGQASRFDVLTYNFLKEFMEEMFGYEPLIHEADSGRLDPDAIFGNPMGELLLAQFADGRARLEIAGISGELTDGTLTILLDARFTDPEFYLAVRRAAKPNFEWRADGDSREPIVFHDAGDLLSGRSQVLGRLTPSSFIALELWARRSTAPGASRREP
ncbi:hypothetical protein [Propionicicella superfundia]|uniref:hypothetical protein n=1 Tax=Propionicicella superfundia TaxID=348582 RepID=UPI000410A003|nr:hypothetical protein [Propionicicella superfundia]